VTDAFDDVSIFHKKFGLPHLGDGDPPRLLGGADFHFRRRFLEEELTELVEAQTAGDLAGVADALVDLVYVAMGTAHLMGLPFDELWAEVQRANLSKERATGADDPRSKRANHLDVVKPEGWVAPDVEGVIRRHVEAAK
jgi:predicted HAD superfamily Cof-like phosphohydrolase